MAYVRRHLKRNRSAVSARTRLTKRHSNYSKRLRLRKRIRRGKGRVNASRMSAMLTDLITMPDYYEDTCADTMDVPSSTAGQGLSCCYFTARTSLYNPVPGTNYGDPWSKHDPLVMANIAQNIQTIKGKANAFPLKFSIKAWHQHHEIYNRSNTPVIIKAYKCMWRRDLPVANNMSFVLDILGNGFASNLIGSGGIHNNSALTVDQYEPFQSSDFVVRAKILRVSRHNIQPGQQISFNLKSETPSMIRPYLSSNISGGAVSYSAAPLIVDYVGGDVFYLFKLSPSNTDRDSVAQGTNSVYKDTRIVSMVTKTKWTYKYVESDFSSTTGTVNGFVTPTVAGASINPLSGSLQTSAAEI